MAAPIAPLGLYKPFKSVDIDPLRFQFDPIEQRLFEENHGLSCAGIGSLIEPSPDESEIYPLLGYLWVYEPQDLEELTLDEVLLVWEHRDALCGSREVAAEVLALVEVMTGQVDAYQGWLHYLERDEIRALMPSVEPIPLMLETAPIATADTQPPITVSALDTEDLAFPPLRRMELSELTDEELQDAWDRRPESFISLEAACGALALLRSRAGIEPPNGWQHLMGHSEILKISDDLPDRDDEENDRPLSVSATTTSQNSMPSANGLRSDQRTRRKQDIVIREGQPGFRQEVLANYYGRCCVTGCRESMILEAAHISPYSGFHSNHPANGLCLRVDIHRLFDGFLISIEPDSRRLVIAPRLSQDATYDFLDGKYLAIGRIPAAQELLADHYRIFQDRHQETIVTGSRQTSAED
ncbi:HNH endonuclease [Vreelandella populi]|uniref:HNH endonuclease n=1 Tax=Vreelandella populi TaxID=2498858 RepID=UPI00163CE9DA|nr:HNH endonuclease [Halomonas populi]